MNSKFILLQKDCQEIDVSKKCNAQFFVALINVKKPLTNVTKGPITDVANVLDITQIPVDT